MNLRWYRFDEVGAERLYELLRFRQAIFVVEQRSPYPDLDGLDRGARHLLLEDEGGLAGCLRLIPQADPPRVRIGRVAVAQAWRRRGCARRLMCEALRVCAKDYPDRPVVLSAQSWLALFYEGLGFTAVSTPYDDFGVPHVDMARPAAIPP